MKNEKATCSRHERNMVQRPRHPPPDAKLYVVQQAVRGSYKPATSSANNHRSRNEVHIHSRIKYRLNLSYIQSAHPRTWPDRQEDQSGSCPRARTAWQRCHGSRDVAARGNLSRNGRPEKNRRDGRGRERKKKEKGIVYKRSRCS